MSGVDALSAISQAISAGGSVELLTESSESTTSFSAAFSVKLVPPDIVLPKTQETRYLKLQSTTEFYTVGALALLYLFRDASSAEYMKQAREAGLSGNIVPITERREVLEYLQQGGTSRNDRVVPLRSTTPTSDPVPLEAVSPSKAPAAAASSTKRRYVPSASDLEAVKRIKSVEVELRDRNTVLRGIKVNNFTALRQTYSAHLKKLRGEASSSSSSKPGASAPSTTSTTPEPPKSPGVGRKGRQYPIIMISSSPTALITMWNVEKFLSDAQFVPSADARDQAVKAGQTRPEPLIQIYRKVSTVDSSNKEVTQTLRYQIVDGVETLNRLGGGGSDPWERVVCVMTTGQAWQFKPYKWSEPRVLFHHVKGMYATWSSDPPNPKIKDWNVTELKIDNHRRHLDKSSVAHFWKVLDDWVLYNKPWVLKG
ncbi:RNA polymerase II-associated protein [Flagelloscypha sp. PMI_526]|nr:RNA polymerase II-associated protein [Flagelloscypha sp. PMI_526]